MPGVPSPHKSLCEVCQKPVQFSRDKGVPKVHFRCKQRLERAKRRKEKQAWYEKMAKDERGFSPIPFIVVMLIYVLLLILSIRAFKKAVNFEPSKDQPIVISSKSIP